MPAADGGLRLENSPSATLTPSAPDGGRLSWYVFQVRPAATSWCAIVFAVVAAAVDPAHQYDLLPGVGGAVVRDRQFRGRDGDAEDAWMRADGGAEHVEGLIPVGGVVDEVGRGGDAGGDADGDEDEDGERSAHGGISASLS